MKAKKKKVRKPYVKPEVVRVPLDQVISARMASEQPVRQYEPPEKPEKPSREPFESPFK